jgi:hypothetical protein
MNATEAVNATVITVRIARDGKRYPADRVLPPEQRQQAHALAHGLVHRDKLSIRQAQRELLEVHAIRRSVGSIFSDLHRYQCSRCAE